MNRSGILGERASLSILLADPNLRGHDSGHQTLQWHRFACPFS